MRKFCLFVSVATLAACSGGSAPNTYVLRAPASPAPISKKQCNATLRIDRPHVREAYDTPRIAVMRDAVQMTYYTGAAWASPFPDQLRDFMADALAQRTNYRLITNAEDVTGHAPQLELFVTEADVITPDAPQVHLRLTAQLRRSDAAAPYKTITVDETVAASEKHMPEIIAAFSKAADQAAEKIAAALPKSCR